MVSKLRSRANIVAIWIDSKEVVKYILNKGIGIRLGSNASTFRFIVNTNTNLQFIVCQPGFMRLSGNTIPIKANTNATHISYCEFRSSGNLLRLRPAPDTPPASLWMRTMPARPH